MMANPAPDVNWRNRAFVSNLTYQAGTGEIDVL
jgi:hypothetical protein